MAAARTKQSAGNKQDNKVEVILDKPLPKKHSVRFETEEDGKAINNVYLAMAAFNQLGQPSALKITIEAHNPDS